MKFLTTLMLLAAASMAQGSILTLQPGTKTIEGVTAAASGSLNLKGQNIALEPVCAALRWKPVLVAKINAYVGQILSTDASKFVRNESEAISSLDLSRTVVFHYTMLRNVDTETLVKSFREGLIANGVDMNLPHIAALVQAVKGVGDIQNKQMMFAAVQKNADGTETLFFENPSGAVSEITGPQGFMKQMIAIWLGVPADKGIKAFKEACIAGN